jgi:hypothetical protein
METSLFFFHLQQFAKVICHILSFNNVLRGCLVPYRIQNTKYQLLWSDKIQNIKIFRIIFSSIQNAEFIVLVKPLVAKIICCTKHGSTAAARQQLSLSAAAQQ